MNLDGNPAPAAYELPGARSSLPGEGGGRR